eukprot:scaffold24983_cov107-Isochrysis_galbana.AAC.3
MRSTRTDARGTRVSHQPVRMRIMCLPSCMVHGAAPSAVPAPCKINQCSVSVQRPLRAPVRRYEL